MCCIGFVLFRCSFFDGMLLDDGDNRTWDIRIPSVRLTFSASATSLHELGNAQTLFVWPSSALTAGLCRVLLVPMNDSLKGSELRRIGSTTVWFIANYILAFLGQNPQVKSHVRRRENGT